MKYLLALILLIPSAFALVTPLKTDDPAYFKILNFELNKTSFKEVEKVYKDIKTQVDRNGEFVCLTDGRLEVEFPLQGPDKVITAFILTEKSKRECFETRDVSSAKIYGFAPGVKSKDVTETLGRAYQMPSKTVIQYSRKEPYNGGKDEQHTYLTFETDARVVKLIKLRRLIGINPQPAKVVNPRKPETL